MRCSIPSLILIVSTALCSLANQRTQDESDVEVQEASAAVPESSRAGPTYADEILLHVISTSLRLSRELERLSNTYVSGDEVRVPRIQKLKKMRESMMGRHWSNQTGNDLLALVFGMKVLKEPFNAETLIADKVEELLTFVKQLEQLEDFLGVARMEFVDFGLADRDSLDKLVQEKEPDCFFVDKPGSPQVRIPAGCIVLNAEKGRSTPWVKRVYHIATQAEYVLVEPGQVMISKHEDKSRTLRIFRPFYMAVRVARRADGELDTSMSLQAVQKRLEDLNREEERVGRWTRVDLPTEDEWEYAHRAGSPHKHWWGDQEGKRGFHPRVNPWGVEEMLCKRAEMCRETTGSKENVAILRSGLCRSANKRRRFSDIGDHRTVYRLVLRPHRKSSNMGLPRYFQAGWVASKRNPAGARITEILHVRTNVVLKLKKEGSKTILEEKRPFPHRDAGQGQRPHYEYESTGRIKVSLNDNNLKSRWGGNSATTDKRALAALVKSWQELKSDDGSVFRPHDVRILPFMVPLKFNWTALTSATLREWPDGFPKMESNGTWASSSFDSFMKKNDGTEAKSMKWNSGNLEGVYE